MGSIKLLTILLVTIAVMAGYTMKLDLETSDQVDLHGDVLQHALEELHLMKLQLKMIEERLEFQNSMVVPMWLYFEHKPKLRARKPKWLYTMDQVLENEGT